MKNTQLETQTASEFSAETLYQSEEAGNGLISESAVKSKESQALDVDLTGIKPNEQLEFSESKTADLAAALPNMDVTHLPSEVPDFQLTLIRLILT